MAKDQATIFLQQLLNAVFQHMEDNEFAKMMLKNIIDDEEENQICYQTTLTHQQFKEFKSVWQKHANTIKQWINYGKLNNDNFDDWFAYLCQLNKEMYIQELVKPTGLYQCLVDDLIEDRHHLDILLMMSTTLFLHHNHLKNKIISDLDMVKKRPSRSDTIISRATDEWLMMEQKLNKYDVL